MNHDRTLEGSLALLLNFGTWLASGVVALGLALTLIGEPGTPVVTTGIALLILLPILRVAVMLAAFVAARDYRFGAIAALVLTIIGLGFALGLHMKALPG
jgi:uncharacterized membrane protein